MRGLLVSLCLIVFSLTAQLTMAQEFDLERDAIMNETVLLSQSAESLAKFKVTDKINHSILFFNQQKAISTYKPEDPSSHLLDFQVRRLKFGSVLLTLWLRGQGVALVIFDWNSSQQKPPTVVEFFSTSENILVKTSEDNSKLAITTYKVVNVEAPTVERVLEPVVYNWP